MQKIKLAIILVFSILHISPAYSVFPLGDSPFVLSYDIDKEAQKITKGLLTILIKDPNLLYSSNLMVLVSDSAQSLVVSAIERQMDSEDDSETEIIATELLDQLLFLISYEGKSSSVSSLVKTEATLYLSKVTVADLEKDEYFYDGISGLDFVMSVYKLWPFKSIFKAVMADQKTLLQESNLLLLLSPMVVQHINQFIQATRGKVNESNIHEVTEELLDRVLRIIGTSDKSVRLTRGQRWMAKRDLSNIFGDFRSSFQMSHFGSIQENTCKALMSNQVIYMN